MGHSSYDSAEVVGAVLAGGKSRRMGAAAKSLKPLGGKPMIHHVIERLRPQVGTLIINANGDPLPYAPFGLPVVADGFGDYAGPLAGLLAAMHWAQYHWTGARWVATVACDTPFLPENYVKALACAAVSMFAPGHPPIAVAASPGGTHYVSGLWPIELADDLAACLANGVRKVQLWVERHPHIAVQFRGDGEGGQFDPFFNVNTPDELAAAGRLLQGEHKT